MEVAAQRDLADGDGATARNGASRPATDIMSPVALLVVLLRHRVLIVTLAVVSAVTVVLVGVRQERTYTANITFMPQSRGSAPGLSGVAAQFGLNLPQGDAGQSPGFYVDLIGSRKILGSVLDTVYTFADRGRRVTRPLVDVFAPQREPMPIRRDRALRVLRSRIGANVTPRTGLVVVSATTTSPELSAAIANRVVAEVSRFNLESRQSQAAAERHFTEQRLAEAKAELRGAESDLEGFLSANRVIANSPELLFREQRLQREVTLRQELYATLAQAYDRAKIEEVRDTPVITVIEPAEAPLWPDPRGLVKLAVFAFVLGTMLGVVVALVRAYFLRVAVTDSDVIAALVAERRAAVGDLLHPWRPVARALSRH